MSQLERPTPANSYWIEVTSFTKGTSLVCMYVLAPKAAEGAPKAAGRGAPVRAAILRANLKRSKARFLTSQVLFRWNESIR